MRKLNYLGIYKIEDLKMINIQSSSQQTIQKLIDVVGKKNVMTGEKDTRLYRQGRRYGAGNVLAVVIPGTLVEQWKVLKIAVDDGCIVIMQAANTGLTGGSTPFGDDYDRPVLLMSTRQ